MQALGACAHRKRCSGHEFSSIFCDFLHLNGLKSFECLNWLNVKTHAYDKSKIKHQAEGGNFQKVGIAPLCLCVRYVILLCLMTVWQRRSVHISCECAALPRPSERMSSRAN